MRNSVLTTVMTATIAFGMFLLPGCLERKETITVHRDGRVEFLTEIEGDPADFEGGDALPNEEAGWSVEDGVKKENDKETKRRMAKMTVAEGKPLPDAYVDSDNPLHEIALRFPTEVKIEKRSDGVYYHFRRVYKAREHARYAIYQKAIQENEQLKSLAGKDPSELTDDERRTLVGALRDAEAGKRAEFLMAGYEAMKERWPQHYYLVARETLLTSFAQADIESLVTLLSQPEGPGRDLEIGARSEAWLKEADEAVVRALRELGAREPEIAAFYAAVQKEQDRRGVTEDIGDERWSVRVLLPGELIAHNAPKLDDGVPTWEFHAELLHDRDHVLMATSRVDR